MTRQALSKLLTQEEESVLVLYLARVFGEPTVETATGPIKAELLLQSERNDLDHHEYSLAGRSDCWVPSPVMGKIQEQPEGYLLDERELEQNIDFVRTVVERSMGLDAFDEKLAKTAIKDLAAQGEVVSNAYRYCMMCGEIVPPGA